MNSKQSKFITKIALDEAEKRGCETIGEAKAIFNELKQTRPLLTNPLGMVQPDNELDLVDLKNHMAFIDGHYPVGISDCYAIGLNGGCGYECLVFKRGECELQAEMEEQRIKDESL